MKTNQKIHRCTILKKLTYKPLHSWQQALGSNISAVHRSSTECREQKTEQFDRRKNHQKEKLVANNKTIINSTERNIRRTTATITSHAYSHTPYLPEEIVFFCNIRDPAKCSCRIYFRKSRQLPYLGGTAEDISTETKNI